MLHYRIKILFFISDVRRNLARGGGACQQYKRIIYHYFDQLAIQSPKLCVNLRTPPMFIIIHNDNNNIKHDLTHNYSVCVQGVVLSYRVFARTVVL